MIVEARLPEPSTPSDLPTRLGCSPLESIHEQKDGSTVLVGSDKRMQVIGHQTVGEDIASAAHRLLSQNMHDELVEFILDE
jgi:hypothetical protein